MKFIEQYGSMEIEFEDSDTYSEKQVALTGFSFLRSILQHTYKGDK